MPLFDRLQRTENRPKRQNEDAFSYLNSSARPMVQAVRELLDTWFSHYPRNGAADLKARFRSRDYVQHQSAFFELYWHEFLIHCGYQVRIHPTLDDVSTNPDFLALKNDSPCFYLEATIAMPATGLAADKRLAELHDTLDRVNSPDFFLEMEYRGVPQGNLRGRQLRGQLERWLKGLNHEEIRMLYSASDFDSVPDFSYEEMGISIIFTPIPKGPENRGRPGVRTIGITSPSEMRFVRVHDNIRTALEGKAKKYGSLSLPLVVAVNVMDEFHDDIALKEALFGEEETVVYQSTNGEWHHKSSRKPNGVWHGQQGPRNRVASAAITTNKLLPWTLRSEKVDLFHNPWAIHPLPMDTFPIPQRTLSLEDGKINQIVGILPADVLGIPVPWPASDDESSVQL